MSTAESLEQHERVLINCPPLISTVRSPFIARNAVDPAHRLRDFVEASYGVPLATLICDC